MNTERDNLGQPWPADPVEDFPVALAAYASRGWPVLPVHSIRDGACTCGNPACSSPGKHPLADLAPNGLKDATTDLATLDRWYRQRPDANWAIATGATAGVVVLDVDADKGGLETLDALKLDHGWMIETPTVRTGGGGLHIYLEHPGELVRNSASRLGPGLDVRGDGGYVLAPPSCHASGKAYTWSLGLEDCPPEEIPAWLLAMLQTAPAPEPAAANGSGEVCEGGRNNWLTSLAGTLRRKGLDGDAIEQALAAANLRHCRPPLPADEVTKIALSAVSWTPGPVDVVVTEFRAEAAERGLVSTLLSQPELLKHVADLTPAHFVGVDLRRAWADLTEAARSGRKILLADHPHLANLPEAVGTLWEVAELGQRLRDAYTARAGMELGQRLVKVASEGNVTALRDALAKARLPAGIRTGLGLNEAAAQLRAEIETPGQDVVRCGFSSFDGQGALRRAELFVLASRPSMGKTQILAQMADYVDRDGGVAVFGSLEMPAKHIVARIVSAACGVSWRSTDPKERETYAQALAEHEGRVSRLVIVDRPTTTSEFFAEVRRVADEHGRLDLVLTDHLRLFRDTRRDGSEVKRLGEIAWAHKEAAKELSVPVVAAAQLNRGPEGRDDKRPGLADLRDSGEIEEDADVVAFLYRPGHYEARKDGKADQGGEAQVYMAKNRNGPLWGMELWFTPERGGRFSDMLW